MSLLQIVQDAADLLSIPRPSTVVSSTDQQVRTLYALANEEGKDLASRGNWQALVEEQTFVTAGTPSQPSAVPTDWDHFIPNSFYNRSTQRPLIGPMTPQMWQAIQARPALGRVYLNFRQRGGLFLITPTPSAGQTIAYEYVSANWAQSPTGTPQSRFMADADTSYLDEGLMTLGIRWRFLKTKGLDYGEDFKTYERQVEQAFARDGGSSALSIASDGRVDVRAQLPEGSFPGPGF